MWASVALTEFILPRTPLSKILMSFRSKFEICTEFRQSTLAKRQSEWDDTRSNKLREVKPVVHLWRSYCFSAHR